MNTMSNLQSHVQGLEEVNLADALYELWAHKWLILVCVALTLSLGVIYTFRLVPQYQSSVLLQVDNKQPGFGGTANSLQAMFTGTGSNDSAATQMSLIQSRFILEPVIERLGLNISARSQASSWQHWLFPRREISLKTSVLSVPQQWLNQPLTLVLDKPEHVSLYDQKGQLLVQGAIGKALVSSKDSIKLQIDSIKAPVGSKFTLVKQSDERVVQNLSGRLSIEEFGSKAARQNTGILEVKLRGSNPEELVRILNTLAVVTQVKDAEKKAQEAAQTLDFLYKQLPITKNLLQNAERDLNRYRAKSGKIDIKLQAQFLLNQLADISKQEGELRINKIQMSQQYTAAHPMMIAVDTQFKALELEEIELRNELKKLPESDQVAVNLMRDVKVKQALYTLLLKKIQELQVVKAGTISSVRLLAQARLPDAPLPSKKVVLWLASGAFGLMLSILIIFGRKLLWPRVNDPHWSEKHFNLPNLAIVPYCKEQFDTLTASGLLPLIAHTNPRNLAVESLRSLRTSLQVTLACASNNLISILGVCPGVGKSFISANLAYLLAAGGKRVLLIDGDLRRGTMHKYFGIAASPGLAEVLTQEVTLEQGLKSSVLHENLSLLSRGAYPADPSELLMNERFKSLLELVSQQYDVVVFDTAPVLLVTDAVVISGYAATNYLVVSAGAHQPSEIELVLKRLSSAGVKVQGSIFNFQRNAIKNNAYYGKYYKHSYYYDESLKA